MSERENDKLEKQILGYISRAAGKRAARYTEERGTREIITFPVDLKDVNEVIDFVNLANKVDYDVDLRYGSCIYDAKSVISAMLISAARSVVMQVHADCGDEQMIRETFERYICA